MEDYNSGHRKRLREMYRTVGIEGMNDYQVLELLLTYAIPRKDVRVIAKKLLKTFGSVENVLLASPNQLESVEGIGQVSAVFLNLVHDVNRSISLERLKSSKTIQGSEDAREYFKEMYLGVKIEKLAVMCFDNSDKILSCDFVSEGMSNTVTVDIRRLITMATEKTETTKVMIAHNHPNGLAFPSADDVNFTLKIRDLFSVMNIELRDHIIVGDNAVFSMRSSPEYNYYFRKRGAT